MKHLVKISAISALLLFASNGWANEAFDNCIAIAEEANNNVLQPTDWSKIEDAIDKEEAGVDAEAYTYSVTAPATGGQATRYLTRKMKREEYKQKRLQEIQQKRIDLEYDKQEEQSKISESKRDAIKDYIELLKVCADLNVIKFEGEVELKE